MAFANARGKARFSAFCGRQYRIYPTKDQRRWIDLNIYGSVLMYNLLLKEMQRSLAETGSFSKKRAADFTRENPFFRKLDSQALDAAEQQLHLAYKNWGRHSTNQRAPVLKKYNQFNGSYSTRYNACAKTGCLITPELLKIPCLSEPIKVRSSQTPYFLGPTNNQRITLTKKCGNQYYVSIIWGLDEAPIKNVPKNAVGLDFAMHSIYVASDGTTGSLDWLPKVKRVGSHIKDLKAKLAKCTPGSHRSYKLKAKIEKLKKHITDCEKDYAKKVARKLINSYDVICVENLNLSKMRARGFAGWRDKINNLSYDRICNYTAQLANSEGKFFTKIEKYAPTTRECSACGYTMDEGLALDIRTYVCPSCGNILDRDINASRNILRRGLGILFPDDLVQTTALYNTGIKDKEPEPLLTFNPLLANDSQELDIPF